MYRLNTDRLRAAAASAGDTSGYAIARTTGIAESSVYRVLNGEAQPDLITALRFAETYQVSVESLMDRIDADAKAVA